MKLYYSKGACSLAVRIVICELGVACEFEAVDLHTKKTESGIDYLTINPKGSVPALLLDSKEILTENAVIQQYLADEFKASQLLPPVGVFKRYRVLEWLNYVSTELHKGFGPLFNPKLPQDIKDNIVKPALKAKFDFVDQHLSHSKYLVGDQFSLADGYLFVMIFWLPNFNINSAQWQNITRYFADLKNRKSIHQALADEKLL